MKKLKSELLNRGLPSNEKKRIYQEGLSEKKTENKKTVHEKCLDNNDRDNKIDFFNIYLRGNL